MTADSPSFTHDPERDLLLERLVDVPVELVWQAWTDPEHLKAWFAPRPFETIECEIDLRPGGIFRPVMRAPDGTVFNDETGGCFLEVHEPHRLVWTSALAPGYRPLPIHASRDSAAAHEDMGFSGGWSTALDQLVEHLSQVGRP